MDALIRSSREDRRHPDGAARECYPRPFDARLCLVPPIRGEREVTPATSLTLSACAGFFVSPVRGHGKDGHPMDRQHEETREAGGYGVPLAAAVAAEIPAPAALQRTTHLRALDHLAAALRAACSDGALMTWAHIAQCTLSAAQHASPSAATEGNTLRRRMVLNDDLFRAFMARQHGQPWTMFDGPTLLRSVADLIAVERDRPTPDPA